MHLENLSNALAKTQNTQKTSNIKNSKHFCIMTLFCTDNHNSYFHQKPQKMPLKKKAHTLCASGA